MRFFCGISLSHSNFYTLSETSQVSSSFILPAISHLSETIVFAYLGTSLFSSAHKWDFALVTLAVIFCVIGRACNTFPLSFLSNCRRKKKIPLKMQVVIWFAGLRGAIAFTSDRLSHQCALYCHDDPEHRHVLTIIYGFDRATADAWACNVLKVRRPRKPSGPNDLSI